MPASNQLLDGDTVRNEIASGNFVWTSGDPGTGTLPSNRILTWADYKTYIGTAGTTQFSDAYCPTYQNMLTYRMLSAPTLSSAADASFCDGSTFVPAISITWTGSGDPVEAQQSADNVNWVDAGGYYSGNSATVLVAGNSPQFIRIYRVNVSTSLPSSPYSASRSVRIAFRAC